MGLLLLSRSRLPVYRVLFCYLSAPYCPSALPVHPNSLALLEFLKEALPGSDVLPLATIAWTLANAYSDSAAARALGLDFDERDDDEFR